MMQRLAACLAIASLTFLAPRPAAAAPTTYTFDTVDALELSSGTNYLSVTGILVGQTTTTTLTFSFSSTDVAGRCDRFAALAISKPGKYRFAVFADLGSGFSASRCKLILRTP